MCTDSAEFDYDGYYQLGHSDGYEEGYIAAMGDHVPGYKHALNISLGFNLGFIAVILGLLFSVTHYCM